MVIVSGGSLEVFRSEIDPVLDQWTDLVVPRDVEIMPNFGYTPDYAWMYSYEKRLKYRIEACSRRPLGSVERLLFGEDGVFSEAVSNAFVHGNRRRTDLPIEIVTVVGERGLAFSIGDCGDGFDFEATLAAVSRGLVYFKCAGNGLRALNDREDVVASYARGGRVLHLRVVWLDYIRPRRS